MSQLAQTAQRVATPAPSRRQRQHPVNRDELSNIPTRKGIPGVLDFLDELGVHGISPTRIKNASQDGELRRFVISGHLWYADRDIWDFLESLASGGQEAQR